MFFIKLLKNIFHKIFSLFSQTLLVDFSHLDITKMKMVGLLYSQIIKRPLYVLIINTELKVNLMITRAGFRLIEPKTEV